MISGEEVTFGAGGSVDRVQIVDTQSLPYPECSDLNPTFLVDVLRTLDISTADNKRDIYILSSP